jgi:hypothetical protein
MNRLRNRLILAFLAATVFPLGATLWIATSLLDRSLAYTTTNELDELSRSLEQTARELYRQSRENLKADADAGRIPPSRFTASARSNWPPAIKEFQDSGESERFALSGAKGNRVDYLRRHDDEIWVYSREIGNTRMEDIRDQYRRAREIVADAGKRDLRRGFRIPLIILVAAVYRWCR